MVISFILLMINQVINIQNFLEANIVISNLHSNCLPPKMYKRTNFSAIVV